VRPLWSGRGEGAGGRAVVRERKAPTKGKGVTVKERLPYRAMKEESPAFVHKPPTHGKNGHVAVKKKVGHVQKALDLETSFRSWRKH